MDKKDSEIITLLQRDAWLTHSKIGEIVHLSPSAVQRRVDRLRAKGIIKGATAQIDPAALGRKTRLYFLLELNNDSGAALTALTDSLTAQPDVSSVELLAGKFDVLLTVDCENAEAFFEVAMAALNNNENVRHCWTLTRLKSLS